MIYPSVKLALYYTKVLEAEATQKLNLVIGSYGNWSVYHQAAKIACHSILAKKKVCT